MAGRRGKGGRRRLGLLMAGERGMVEGLLRYPSLERKGSPGTGVGVQSISMVAAEASNASLQGGRYISVKTRVHMLYKGAINSLSALLQSWDNQHTLQIYNNHIIAT